MFVLIPVPSESQWISLRVLAIYVDEMSVRSEVLTASLHISVDRQTVAIEDG